MKYCETCHNSFPDDFTICPKDRAPLRSTSELLHGMVLRDKYEILEKIGSGGFGSVYRARHLVFNELRAIKVMSGRFAEDRGFLRRFKTEAVITRRLQHPNAVRVDDLDTTADGRPFIVMEYVEGRDLRKVMQQENCLPVPRALNIAQQVASALTAAHALGITHRDIKPDNILLIPKPDGADLVKVLDFGIAKVREGVLHLGSAFTSTDTGVVVGTPQFVSPEQARGDRGEQIDGRSDLYSLGVVLYRVITGRLPFESDTPMGFLLHHLQTTPPPPHILRPDLNIPEPVSALVMKALEKDRTRRFQTADEMWRALDRPSEWATTQLLASETPPAPSSKRAQPVAAPPTGGSPAIRFRVGQTPAASRGKPWARLALLATLLVMVIVAALLGFDLLPQPRLAPPSTVLSPAGAPPTVVTDEKIRSEVQASLAAAASLREAVITVIVEKGTVTLSGTAPAPGNAELAAKLARAVSGVAAVNNKIELADRSSAGPAWGPNRALRAGPPA